MKITRSLIALASVLGLVFSAPLSAHPATSKNLTHGRAHTLTRGGMEHCPMARQGMMDEHTAMMGHGMGQMNPHGTHGRSAPSAIDPTKDATGSSSEHGGL